MEMRTRLTVNPQTLVRLEPIFSDDDFRDFCDDEDDLELTDPEGIMLSPVRSASPLSEES